MIKKLRNVIIVSLMVFGLLAVPVAVTGDVAYAVDPADKVQDGVNKIGGGGGRDLEGFIKIVINIILFIAGAIAVIMIILGGLRFITSNGDQSQVKAGRETVLYAVIGLIVAIMAFAIVNFVVDRL